MKRKQEQNDKAQTKISRPRRNVKKVPSLKQDAPYGRIARVGRWTTNDKQKLLRCLQRYPCSQYNPLTVFRSLKIKTKGQVEEYILKLRRRTADHTEQNRKIQPSILTWFQVADEVTWLKDDEDLDEIIPALLDIHAVEANSMQQRNPLLNFSNLYKYLKVLHKSEHLPQLTPAESVVLLDCFQQLADILRASDTEPQAEFMQNQYRKYFQRLYFAASDMTESRLKLSAQESEAKSKAGKTSVAKQKGQSGRKPSIRPLMKAELRKKPRRRRTAGETAPEETTQKDVESQNLQTEVPDGSNRIQEGLEREGESSQERDECQTSPVGKESLNERLDVGGDRVVDEVSDDMHGRCGEGPIGEATGQDVNDDTLNNDDELCHNLDPNDPDFLAKFADMFSLGSLNPFEIPPELMDFRPKPQGRQTANGNVSNQTDGGGTEISEGGTVGDEAIEIDNQGQPSQGPEVDLDHQGVSGTSTAGSNRDQYCGHVNKVTGQEVSSNGMEDQRNHHAGIFKNNLSGEVQSGLSSTHQLQLSSNHLPVVSSDHLPDVLSDRLPEVSSAGLPDVSSDRLPVVSSDHLPDISIDRLPVISSDRLPDVSSDRLPEVSSDRLPEVSCSSQIDISSDTLHKTSSDQLTDPSIHHCAVTAHQPEVSSVCQSNGSSVILAQVSSVLQTQLSSEQVPEASTTHCHEVPSSHSPEVPSTSTQLPEASTAHCHEVPSSHSPEVPSTTAP